ncbi:MAG: hypothetical protein QOE75_2869 [Solirubrobacterales bacterium]|nr:hypothetical protein [Solirubrobacterales bacterium]
MRSQLEVSAPRLPRDETKELSPINARSRTPWKFRVGFLLAITGLVFLAGVSSAAAVLVPGSFDGAVLKSDGTAETRAGAHPYSATTKFELEHAVNSNGALVPKQNLRNVSVDLPRGFVVDPSATAICGPIEFAEEICSAASQVGVARTTYSFSPSSDTSGFFTSTEKIYNVEPLPSQPALFAYKVFSVTILLTPEVRPGGDFGLSARVKDASMGVPVFATEIELFGVPADRNEGGGTRRPMVTNPTACTGPLRTSLTMDFWQGAHETAFFDSHLPAPNEDVLVGPEDCDELLFDPTIEIAPTATQADSPTGLAVDLAVPQRNDPDGRVTSHLKSVKVTMPQGMSVTPAAADGLGDCRPAQIALSSPADANCPESSKVGSIEIRTPLLDDPMPGSIYLAAQKDNPFNETLALYIVGRGPGVVIKLPGKVEPDPGTGQLVATFDNNPQLPFSSFSLRFNGGERAPLATPPTCGIYEIKTEIAPWSANDPGNPTPGEIVTSTSEFTIDSGPGGGPCLAGDPNRPGGTGDLGNRPFDVGLQGGLVNAMAGSSSPFVLQLTRPDGHQEISSFKVDLPPGLTAKLAGVPYCSDAALAGVSGVEGTGAAQLVTPSCPASSQIGTVTIGAGAGNNPFYVRTGKAYLAGPYKGAPLSLAVVTPAVAGPFDLGSVLVRSRIEVDRDDAQVHVMTDPLPQIIAGIPLRLRDIRVRMDRPGFMRAPTNCTEMQMAAQATGSHGGSSTKAQRFKVGECTSLKFKPKLSLRLKGKVKRSGHPALTAVLTQPGGQANIGRVSVTLPRSQFIDQSRIGEVCTRAQFAAAACPDKSVLGIATAYSPLLDQPLRGSVYLRANGGERELPDMVAALRGQIDVDLVGYIDAVVKPGTEISRIRNTFAIIPDAPVSKFVLKLNSGKKALLENSANLCAAPQRATVKMTGQNGKVYDTNPLVKIGCARMSKNNR